MNGRRGPEAHCGIKIVVALAAGARGHVGNARLHADAIARRKVVHLVADSDDDAGSLVAEHHGRLDDEGADAAVLVIVHIAAADAHAADADADIAGSHVERKRDFAEREAEFFFKHESFHDAPNHNLGRWFVHSTPESIPLFLIHLRARLGRAPPAKVAGCFVNEL